MKSFTGESYVQVIKFTLLAWSHGASCGWLPDVRSTLETSLDVSQEIAHDIFNLFFILHEFTEVH
jgi:hypothetical protein